MRDHGPFSENGLLPPICDDEIEWLRPAFEGSPDPIAAAVVWARDIAEIGHLVWPAAVDGVLTRPPLEHVLDHLTRREFGDSPSEDVQTEFQLHAHAGTVAVVHELPSCDLCTREGRPAVEARYDGPVGPEGKGPWAFMCLDCYPRTSTGRLGTGEGQYLLREYEVPQEVWDALERARTYWRGKGA